VQAVGLPWVALWAGCFPIEIRRAIFCARRLVFIVPVFLVSFFEFSFEVRRNVMRQKLNWMAVLLVVLACGAVAQASTLTTGSPYDTNMSGGTGWSTIPSISQLGKVWTYMSGSGTPGIPSNMTVDFTVQSVNGLPNHTLNLGNNQANVFGPGNYDLQYNVAVAAGNPQTFYDASLGVNLVGSPGIATVTKTLTNANNLSQSVTLTSVNGQTDSTDTEGSILGWTSINVNEEIVVSQGQINNISNNFVETPEPSTLALLGVGFVGLLGYVWRRKRAA
jgi:hypothetical protein